MQTSSETPAAPVTEPTPVTPPATPVAGSLEPSPPADTPPVAATLLGGEEGKTQEGANGKADAKATDVPDKYTVTLPDGMALDEKLLGDLSPVFKEAGVSNETAQKLATAYAKHQQDSFTEYAKQVADERKAWVNELRKDPDFDATLASGQRAVALAGKEVNAVKALLNDTGLGDNPIFVRWMAAIGAHLSEGSFIASQGNSSPAFKDKKLSGMLYGATTPAS